MYLTIKIKANLKLKKSQEYRLKINIKFKILVNEGTILRF
jgi:hypothetical protein